MIEQVRGGRKNRSRDEENQNEERNPRRVHHLKL